MYKHKHCCKMQIMTNSIYAEDPTSTWVTKSSILLNENDQAEFTPGGKSAKEKGKVK